MCSSDLPARLGLAYAMAFQLLNTVEEHASESMRRLREGAEGPEAERGLWGDALASLRDAGASPADVLRVMAGVEVEPVFTAHPTEAKRSSVLEQHRELMRLLHASFGGMDASSTPAPSMRADVVALLERLWRTGEILLQKPTVADERQIGRAHV